MDRWERVGEDGEMGSTGVDIPAAIAASGGSGVNAWARGCSWTDGSTRLDNCLLRLDGAFEMQVGG
jgi:hypothetical protein